MVLPLGDRSLRGVNDNEHPDLALVRQYIFKAVQCLQHVHESGFTHQEIKMSNFIRLDGDLRLTDMDAALRLDCDLFAGAKFSSSTLGPEMFHRFQSAEEIQQFEEYFDEERRSGSRLWRKIKPVTTKDGFSYCVKTYKLGPGGLALSEGLPYSLIRASKSQDIWAMGAVSFQLLLGEPLLLANRDDDLAGADVVHKAATWTDEELRLRICSCAEAVQSDGVALDFLCRMLRVDPHDRFQSLAETLQHPFFLKC